MAGKLTQEQLHAISAVAFDPVGKPKFAAADWIGVCVVCGDVAVSAMAHNLGVSKLYCTCSVGAFYKKAPHHDALLAAFKIGGWDAVKAACAQMLADAKSG